MPRNITVTFDDGSSHAYNNAPDDVTPEQIEARASRDFAGKRVTALDGGRGRPAAASGTPEGFTGRPYELIPVRPPEGVPAVAAPPAQRAAPVPQEERGLFARIRAGLEAARYTVASIVPGAVGYGVGVLEGITRAATNTPPKDWKPGENLAETRAQQFVDAAVTKPPSALGQEYAQDVGDFARRHGASVAAGPLGVVGTGRHTRAVGDVRTGLRAALGAPGDAPPGLPPPGLPPVVPSAEKPAGGLAKRAVQPNPALLETVPAAERAGLKVLPHHVAEGETVRALGTAAGGDVYKQNTKAFTKALIKELDPEEKSVRLDTKTFHRVLDKQGKTIGEGMAKYDLPVDDAMRSRLEAISKDAADNADADTGRMTMNRVREIIGKAEAGNGLLAGQAARELDTAIGRQIRSNTKNQDLVVRLRAIQDTIRDAAEARMAPDEAKLVQQARRRYAYAMEILPDIDDFGRTGYYEPGQLWKRLTATEAGRQRVANERGGLTDLAKAGALVADRSGVGHGYVSVGANSVGVGAGGMRAYASPSKLLEVGVGVVGGKRAYNRFGPALVKRLAAEHEAEMARAAAKPEPPHLELAPEGAPVPALPRPDVRGEAPAEVPEWTMQAGARVARPGGEGIPAIEPEGLFPAVGDDMLPARINPEPRARVPDIPAVPGRPDMPDVPDVMVVGGPKEVGATEAAGRAMQAPDAALARERQGFAPPKPAEPPKGGGSGPTGGKPPTDPRLAKIAELRERTTSPAVRKVLDAREAEVKKILKREQDVADLEAAAQSTDDVGLRRSLLAEADKLRGGKIPTGEVKEGQPELPKPKAEKIPVGKVIEGMPELQQDRVEPLPVGEATEIMPEVVEPAPERIPVGEATEMPEPLPVGEVTVDPIPVGEAMEFEPLPVGEATEIVPEVVAPARGPVVPEATNVDNPPSAPAGGGRSGNMEQRLPETDEQRMARIKATPGAQRTDEDLTWASQKFAERNAAAQAAQSEAEARAVRATLGEQLPAYLETIADPKTRQKAKDHLLRSAHRAGQSVFTRSLIEGLVKEGRTVEERGGKLRLASQDGMFIEVTKTEADYAKWLARQEKRGPTNSLGRTASWVVRDKATGEAVMETFDQGTAKKVNREKYEVVPVLQHLQDVAAKAKETPRAPQEVTQQASVRAEPEVGTGSRTPAEAGPGDRVPSAAGGEGKAEAQEVKPGSTQGRQAAIDAETMETRRPVEVAQPTAMKSVLVPTVTLSGPKNVRAKLYELPGYDGPQLAVADYKSPRGVGYRVYLPKSGALIQDSNGVQSLADTLQSAVLRVGHARDTLRSRASPKPEALKPTAPAKPTSKVMSPNEVKAEFQRQIDAVPRFGAGGPETITLKAGGSRVKIQNTARRVAEYMKGLDTVKGGKTPKPVSPKTDGRNVRLNLAAAKAAKDKNKRAEVDMGAAAGSKSWLGSTSKRTDLAVIKDMIDDLDPQAAVDFAAAQGIDLEVALKGDARRLSHVMGRKPTPETP